MSLCAFAKNCQQTSAVCTAVKCRNSKKYKPHKEYKASDHSWREPFAQFGLRPGSRLARPQEAAVAAGEGWSRRGGGQAPAEAAP